MPPEWFLLSNLLGSTITLFILLVMQHSQNRDMKASQFKVDELIRSSDARNHMIGIERVVSTRRAARRQSCRRIKERRRVHDTPLLPRKTSTT